eukprot:UN19763
MLYILTLYTRTLVYVLTLFTQTILTLTLFTHTVLILTLFTPNPILLRTLKTRNSAKIWEHTMVRSQYNYLVCSS